MKKNPVKRKDTGYVEAPEITRQRQIRIIGFVAPKVFSYLAIGRIFHRR